MKASTLILLLSVVLICGCRNSSQKEQEIPVEEDLTEVVIPQVIGKYKGVLPCADCSGIETSLHIKENGEYHKVQIYLNDTNKDMQNSFDNFGKWCFSEDSSRIELNYDSPDMALHEYWQIVNNNEVKIILDDKKTDSTGVKLNYSLRRE